MIKTGYIWHQLVHEAVMLNTVCRGFLHQLFVMYTSMLANRKKMLLNIVSVKTVAYLPAITLETIA